LLSSLSIFIGALVAWVLTFGTVYALIVRHTVETGLESSYLHGFEEAIVSFFGMQPPHDFAMMEQTGPLMVWVTLFIIILSFVHLGIFISHLYSIIARR
jgi:hypothetical protein